MAFFRLDYDSKIIYPEEWELTSEKIIEFISDYTEKNIEFNV